MMAILGTVDSAVEFLIIYANVLAPLSLISLDLSQKAKKLLTLIFSSQISFFEVAGGKQGLIN